MSTTIRSKKDQDLIEELEDIMSEMSYLKKKEKNLKTALKEKYEEGTYRAKNIELIIKERSRRSINKEKFIKEYGIKALDNVETESCYKIIELRMIS